MRNSYIYEGIDFTGQRHGMLTVIRKADKGRSWWVCKCDCGNERTMETFRFLSYKSCGCLEKQNKRNIGERTKTHGKTSTKLYGIYCGMKSRCYNANDKHYPFYGGRGIKVCKEWLDSFEAFYDWAYEMGFDDSLTGKEQSIDRIDCNGDYSPSNCRWSNQTEQVRNRRIARWVSYGGELVSPYDFAIDHGITYMAYVYRHLNKGETGEQIIENWRNRKYNRCIKDRT